MAYRRGVRTYSRCSYAVRVNLLSKQRREEAWRWPTVRWTIAMKASLEV